MLGTAALGIVAAGVMHGVVKLAIVAAGVMHGVVTMGGVIGIAPGASDNVFV